MPNLDPLGHLSRGIEMGGARGSGNTFIFLRMVELWIISIICVQYFPKKKFKQLKKKKRIMG